MQKEIHRLRVQVKRLQLVTIAAALLSLLMLIFLFRSQYKNDILRTKGIVIVDSAGRDRILIGAPLPKSAFRVRTDSNLVKKYWAKNYENPAQFMQWYRNYYNSGIGMVVMNEEGFDRVLIGDKLPDPNSGRRQFEAAGIIWNDKQGWERGGAGVNTSKDGEARSVVGVDNTNGEAAHIFALEDGTNAIAIGSSEGLLLLGFSPKNGSLFKNNPSFNGIRFFDANGNLAWEQKMDAP